MPAQAASVGRALVDAGIDPLLARLYAARGVRDADELAVGLERLPDPDVLPGIAAAVEVLREARARDARICIVGDYDADGATSTAVAVLGLRALGFRHVDHLVPNRFEYGYGLTPGIVALAAERPGTPAPDLIVTVDNGIASVDGVETATALGIDVLITDHHLPGSVLPAARAIVNPRLATTPSVFDALAGVGVMFLLLVALRRALREGGELDDGGPNLATLLDLVAVGTIADVVPLSRINRILVAQGLRRIRAGRTRPGILALASVAGRDPARLGASDVGFALAPRLNAAGRLDDMSRGIALLLETDAAAAGAMAAELDALNRARREIEADMRDEAFAAADAVAAAGDLPFGLCVHAPDWHAGVVGIVAARVRERFHRPVIAFAPAGDGGLRGSARSVPGLHVRDALEAVATRHPGLIERFGGHAMAAGLSLAPERLEEFRAAFDTEVRRHLRQGDLDAELVTDGELAPGTCDLATARLLEDAGPWGQAFPEPVFEGAFEVQGTRIVGESHVRLRLRPDGGEAIDAIAFGGVAHGWHEPASRVRLVFRLEVNRFRGTESPQLSVLHLQSA
ncbi:MAG TPA: single-stranded-DNA-specific exonuclease RecJ [Pseudomonadales bacterium]|nr:single-stranded-DNA-specific exonuclease RecJ [Pseudomonadales bacterium]